tara:strand:- start:1713 stop:2711 length:999 start_codon:yes stop_codon:yes gene_type:complete
MKKFILISAGDPNSISTEITIKAIENSKINKNVKPVVVSNARLIEDCKKIIKSSILLNEIEDKVNFSDFKENHLNIISLPIQEDTVLGKENIKYSSFIKSSIITCVKTEISSIASAIVTNPINKKMMYRSGFNFQGHTDFLASLSQNKKIPVMMLVTKEFKTIPMTIHVPLRDVPKLISKDLIEITVNIARESLISLFNITKPRIVVTGLNPHSGENGDIGDEEEKIITPAINETKKKQDCYLEGPISADTAFSSDKRKNYDVIICMYHDQALIPIKTLDFFNGVNVTLGLDFIRTSPDHGTGYDIAGKNIANPNSLIAAINLAYEMSINKK